MPRKVVGVVLAGGQSRRFGAPKAFAKKDGKAFYQFSMDALKRVTESVIVITNPKLELFFHNDNGNFDVINDVKEYQGQGPLAGIYTAMEAISADWYIVVPVDVPFIEEEIINQLMTHLNEDVDAIIPVVTKKVQPLIAIYRNTTKGIIKNGLDQGNLSVTSILDQCPVKYVPMEEEQPFLNINRKKDYEKWIGNDEM